MTKAGFVFLLSVLFSGSAQAATIFLCATYDNNNKYFVVDTTSLAPVQKRVIALCQSRRQGAASCRPNLTCRTQPNSVAHRYQRVVPFPPELRKPAPGRANPGRSQRPTPRPDPSPQPDPTPPRNTNPGGNCRANSDCYSTQYCAGGQCFEKSGGGSQSCKSNSDCYSNDFCVSGQCFPKTGGAGGNCKGNNDCYSYQFCVSGQCFAK